MNKLNKYAVVSFALSLVLLVAAQWESTHRPKPDLEKMAKRVEKKLAANNQDFLKIVNDRLVLNDLITNTYNSKQYNAIAAKPYTFLLYVNGELLVWNNNQDIPPKYLATAVADGNSFLKLDNGYFEIMKVTIKVSNLDLVVVGLSLVRNNYRIENRYLHNNFNPGFGLPDYVDMSLGQGKNTIAVKDPSGTPIFHLKLDEAKTPIRFDDVGMVLNLLACILLLIAINIWVYHFSRRGKAWVAFTLLVLILMGLRALMLVYNFPSEFGQLGLFSPTYFASSPINRSLGDLLINTLLAFNVIVVFFALTPFPRFRFRNNNFKYVVVGVEYVFLSVLAFSIGILFNNLLLNSNIPFDLNNFMSLTTYSFVGLVVISIVLFSYLLITHKVLKHIYRLALPLSVDVGLMFFSVLVFIGYLVLVDASKVFYFTAIWIMLYLLFLRREVHRDKEISSFTNVIVIIILFSLLSSVHVYQYDGMKDRKQVARKLSDQRNRTTEFLFSDVQQKILDDPFVRNFFLTPFISTNELQKRIRTLYFGGYFSKYDLDIYLINKQGQPLQPVNADFYALEDPNAELSPPSEFLYFIPKAGGSYLYFSNLPIQYQNKFIGTIIIKLSPKSYSKTNLYPELLLEESIKPPDEGSIYSFAIYQNDHLVRKEGMFAYSYQFGLTSSNNEYELVHQNGFDHLVYNAGDNKKVVVTSKSDNWLQPVTLFSYLFCFFLIFAFIAVQIRSVVQFVRQGIPIGEFLTMTFKDKIQYSMISLLVLAFLIIGSITIANFTSQYDEYNKRNLVNKQASIKTAIEYGLKDNPAYLSKQDTDSTDDNGGARSIDLASLSDVHSMDVNIYDLQGDIINTSQPDIFSKGLQSDKMDPQAYKYVVVDRQSQYIHNETIGNLKYLSIYVPLTDKEGQVMGFLNLPYFAKEKELRAELSNFLVTLVNVYVFLLVIGGFFAYLLSNSITAPLTIISDKLKFIQFGRKNEPIEWKGNDEIGKLVSEYNKMIDELESSAELLARSERESAWREMAKQVAHEIKNPLTPMKLSIQHLQRAMAEGRPGVEQLANRVSSTLIEQIDNLNHIASEFSSFAKMPTVNNEVFDIAEVVKSVADLFNGENNASVTYVGTDGPVWVYADKNQILRGFNNLVKNATQAIPDEREGMIEVKLEVKSTDVLIAVRDNGIGIGEELRNKVFVPNFTTKGSGTGLGLAITRQIVESTGGEIWFYSAVNIGTTFFVKLPIYMKPIEHER